jgi:hypothetical protein
MLWALTQVTQTAQHATLNSWAIGGGGLALGGAILRLSFNVGKMTQTLEDLSRRMDRAKL